MGVIKGPQRCGGLTCTKEDEVERSRRELADVERRAVIGSLKKRQVHKQKDQVGKDDHRNAAQERKVNAAFRHGGEVLGVLCREKKDEEKEG